VTLSRVVQPPESSRRRSAWALGLTVAALALANVVRSTIVPGGVHLAFNVGLAVAMCLAALRSGLTAEELGVSRRHVRSGLLWGAGAAAVVAAAVAVAALAPSLRDLLDDPRAEVSLGQLLYQVKIRIPLGTVVLEEVAFRGVVLALLVHLTDVRRAILLSSVLFGVWHALPAWLSVDDGAGTIGSSSTSGVVVVAATVAATTVAGIVFALLRVRSRSLVAPMLAHLATNTIPLTAAWVIAR
jgi:membrane protease YdiL (CAAX protease family)